MHQGIDWTAPKRGLARQLDIRDFGEMTPFRALEQSRIDSFPWKENPQISQITAIVQPDQESRQVPQEVLRDMQCLVMEANDGLKITTRRQAKAQVQDHNESPKTRRTEHPYTARDGKLKKRYPPEPYHRL